MLKKLLLIAIVAIMTISTASALEDMRISGQASAYTANQAITVMCYDAAGNVLSATPFNANVTFTAGGVFSFVWVDADAIVYSPDYYVSIEIGGVVIFTKRLDKIMIAQSLFGTLIDPVEINTASLTPFVFSAVTVTGDATVGGTFGVTGNTTLTTVTATDVNATTVTATGNITAADVVANYIGTPDYLPGNAGIRMGTTATPAVTSAGWLNINSDGNQVFQLGRGQDSEDYGLRFNSMTDGSSRAGLGWSGAAWMAGVGIATEGVALSYVGTTADEARIAILVGGVPTFMVDREGDVMAETVTANIFNVATLNVVDINATGTITSPAFATADGKLTINQHATGTPYMHIEDPVGTDVWSLGEDGTAYGMQFYGTAGHVRIGAGDNATTNTGIGVLAADGTTIMFSANADGDVTANGVTSATIMTQATNAVLDIDDDFTGHVAGKYNTLTIQANAVVSSMINDGTIVTADIADGAITSAKIADLNIMNVDVNAAAAIEGTKIAPDFGAQNVVTTGTVTADQFATTNGKLNIYDGGALAADLPYIHIENGATDVWSLGADGTAYGMQFYGTAGHVRIGAGDNATTNTGIGVLAADGTTIMFSANADGDVVATSFTGIGTALTALNGSMIASGTVDEAWLDANVVLDTESPAAADIAGTFAAGLTINNDAVGANELAATTVGAGTYGSSTAIPIVTVDADGRLTTVATTGIAVSSAMITNGTIIDEDINAAANIASSKLAVDVVLDTETPTGGVISGTFAAGLSIDNNAVALATQTTGNYVEDVVAAAGGRLIVTGAASEGANVTVDLNLANPNVWTGSTSFDADINNNLVYIQNNDVNGSATGLSIEFCDGAGAGAAGAGVGFSVTAQSNLTAMQVALNGGTGSVAEFYSLTNSVVIDNTGNLIADGNIQTATLETTGLATLASVDINGGAIDGTVIGANSETTGKFTTLQATGVTALNDNVNISGTTITNRIAYGVTTNATMANISQNIDVTIANSYLVLSSLDNDITDDLVALTGAAATGHVVVITYISTGAGDLLVDGIAIAPNTGATLIYNGTNWIQI